MASLASIETTQIPSCILPLYSRNSATRLPPPPPHLLLNLRLYSTSDIEPSYSDSEPDAVRETMTDIPDPPDDAAEHAEDAVAAKDSKRMMNLDIALRKAPREPTAEARPNLIDISESPEHGHIRSPVLAREPTTLESFSRAIRGYVPSSIPIPSVVPTPPRVSRPVSFGSFLTPNRAESSPVRRRGSGADNSNWKRRGSDVSIDHRRMMSLGDPRVDEIEEAVLNLDEDFPPSETQRPSLTTYPGTITGEEIVCATFGELRDGDTSRRLVMLGYQSGLQIWDCTNLGSVTEVLNLSGSAWGRVEVIEVLSNPRSGNTDEFRAKRPLIGFLSTSDVNVVIIYSLRTHEVVKKLCIPSLTGFKASSDFIVLSTAEPASLHVISARTLRTLYIFPSTSFTLFARPPSTTDIREPVSVHIEHGDDFAGPSHHVTIPQPVFALSHRLIAFASTSSHPASPVQSAARTPRTASQSPFDDGTRRFPTTQAELGLAAMKIGGSLFSGMKAIGGRAYSAARAGVSAAMAMDYTSGSPAPVPGKFFSRSAPEASSHEPERRYSITSDAGSPNIPSRDDIQTNMLSNALNDDAASRDSGYYMTVLDLEPLLSEQATSVPATLAEYMVSKHQPISEIEFAPDGTSLVVASKDGQTMKVYRLRPLCKALRADAATAGLLPDDQYSEAGLHRDIDLPLAYPPWHIYDLRRGRTSAIVERLSWAHDGRWLAVGTRKRTVHLFALNPYGGPTDEGSHLAGRVMNVPEVQPLSTELAPLVRLRLKYSSDDRTSSASAFIFLHQDSGLPPALFPSVLSSQVMSSSPSVARSSSPTQPLDFPANYQDVLVFDAREGVLSLRRVTVSKRAKDNISTVIRTTPIADASISLPGISTMSRLASSTSAVITPARQPSALSRMMERSELVGQDTVVATWPLRRSAGWQEIKQSFRTRRTSGATSRAKSEWLAQAELSTCSRSRKIVPKSIYLAHQFSFHYMGEDYHALLRSHRYDVAAQKIDVRRQVAVSASSMGAAESFVSGSSLPFQAGDFASSFDEPLASALSAELRYQNPSPPVLPMYPNGTLPTRSSGRPAIPIRVAAGLSDGMSEGIGRLRREIGRVKSPRPATRRGVSTSVTLEFDEEDEDFLSFDPPTDAVSRSTSHEGEVLSTPSTGLEPLPVSRDGDDMWQGWEDEDKRAVEEVEQYDDIGVGFMDEEWMKEIN
ncbi:hypothetical protein NM688_g3809 [Phlebia brevispora]|uniref:Uncharacterized protein n=1 Tax=Phlebia brevispora TaxID=194682 RepID=A0ACC1T4S5_9APHY|nr:hypothetical protein NM688_g3809 [Phlebia brevispora]